MTVINAIAGVIMSIINGCVAVLAAIVRFLTCKFPPPYSCFFGDPTPKTPKNDTNQLFQQVATAESVAEVPPERRDGTE